MHSDAFAVVYVTFPDMDSARKAASALLDSKQVACCNILPGMESHYIWQEKREIAHEVVMLCKTTECKVSSVIQQLASLHPYETPAIFQLPVGEISQPFYQWVTGIITS